MDEKERQSALLSALTTEHFVLQTAASATVNESAARASIYVMSLSTSVVAMAFASQSRDAFGPFAASVLPALYFLGVFTIIRLVDVHGEYMHYLARIARIRSYYRALIPAFVAVLIGVGVAAALMAAFFVYQKWRFSMFEPAVPRSRRGDADTKGE